MKKKRSHFLSFPVFSQPYCGWLRNPAPKGWLNAHKIYICLPPINHPVYPLITISYHIYAHDFSSIHHIFLIVFYVQNRAKSRRLPGSPAGVGGSPLWPPSARRPSTNFDMAAWQVGSTELQNLDGHRCIYKVVPHS